MMKMNTIGMYVLLLGITLGFILSTQPLVHAQGTTGDTGGTGGQNPPACPDSFADVGCTQTGTGSDADVTAAFGAAQLECQQNLTDKCVAEQTKEAKKAREKCEAVQGCVFGMGPNDDTACGATGTTAADCTPPPGQDPPGTIYKCTVWGRINYTGYTCKRPVTPPPGPKPADGFLHGFGE